MAERKNQLSVFAAAVFIFLAGAARTGIIAADLGSGAAYGFVRQIELGDFNYALHHFEHTFFERMHGMLFLHSPANSQVLLIIRILFVKLKETMFAGGRCICHARAERLRPS